MNWSKRCEKLLSCVLLSRRWRWFLNHTLNPAVAAAAGEAAELFEVAAAEVVALDLQAGRDQVAVV